MAGRVIRHAALSEDSWLLNGYGSRELLVELGSTPVWLPRFRAWVALPKRGRAAVALAEHRGWATEATTAAHMAALAGAELAEERGVLW